MAIDNREKRQSVLGINALWGPSPTSNASPDQEWRQQAGYGYSGILADAASTEDEIISDLFTTTVADTVEPLPTYAFNFGPDKNLSTTPPATSLFEIGKRNGRYWGHVKDNTADNILHFNQEQGALHAKRIDFPFVVEYYRVGIGTVANPPARVAYATNAFQFGGVQVHAWEPGTYDLQSRESTHFVFGHRGTTAQYCFEAKQTHNGASDVDDDGTNPFGKSAGSEPTVCDMRIEGFEHTPGVWKVRAYYREVGTTTWTAYGSGGGNTGVGGSGVAPDSGGTRACDFSSGQAYIGLITYDDNWNSGAFVGTCDEVRLIVSGGLLVNRSINYGRGML